MSKRRLTPQTQNCAAPIVGESVTGGRSPRIVFIDDEDWFIEMIEMLLQHHFRELTLLTFQNRDTAWRELQRTEPDLLITDMNNNNIPGRTEYMGMSGWELLPRLAKREVKYPILVVSGCFSMPGLESRARKCAGPKLNISFLTKPFSMELFQQEATRLLNPCDSAGRRFPTSGV